MDKCGLNKKISIRQKLLLKYLDEYNRADDKIHLKIVHTYGVVDAAEDIARRMGLTGRCTTGEGNRIAP